MFVPDKETFLQRARQGNLVPVWRELLTDQETPVWAYERLRSDMRNQGVPAYTFLLESVEGGENVARYSFLGGRPRSIFRAWGRHAEFEHADGSREVFRDVDPLAVLRDHMSRYRPVPNAALPRFFGGAVGYIGYDAVAQFERVPLHPSDPLPWPDMLFCLTDTILIFDRVRHTIKVVANALVEDDPGRAYDEAVERIDALCERLAAPVPNLLIDAGDPVPEEQVVSNVSREAFMAGVDRVKEYIRAGDVIQVVLSQRFAVDYDEDPLHVYRALRSVNPSPYMFCLELGDHHVVGSSPEIHVRCEEGEVEVRPIAGTRPRSEDPAKDRQLAEELLADAKERAEHIMLVDLGRNDIGRVCDYRTVRVRDLMVIERYSHVMHIVSDVVGTLSAGRDVYDLMRATFPAGTVSGAPKIRAMEIIAELEAARRGPYAGAVGYFSYTGNLDSCITIRTVLLDGKQAHVQAGAGIVADSDPATEYEETRNKAKGMFKAIALSRKYARARGMPAPGVRAAARCSGGGDAP